MMRMTLKSHSNNLELIYGPRLDSLAGSASAKRIIAGSPLAIVEPAVRKTGEGVPGISPSGSNSHSGTPTTTTTTEDMGDEPPVVAAGATATTSCSSTSGFHSRVEEASPAGLTGMAKWRYPKQPSFIVDLGKNCPPRSASLSEATENATISQDQQQLPKEIVTTNNEDQRQSPDLTYDWKKDPSSVPGQKPEPQGYQLQGEPPASAQIGASSNLRTARPPPRLVQRSCPSLSDKGSSRGRNRPFWQVQQQQAKATKGPDPNCVNSERRKLAGRSGKKACPGGLPSKTTAFKLLLGIFATVMYFVLLGEVVRIQGQVARLGAEVAQNARLCQNLSSSNYSSSASRDGNDWMVDGGLINNRRFLTFDDDDQLPLAVETVVVANLSGPSFQ